MLCSWIPSITLFVIGWVSFKGNIFDLLNSFGIVGEYLKTPGIPFILIAYAFVIFAIIFAKRSVEDSSANKAKAAIAYILTTIISLGATVAVFNANQRSSDFTNQYGTPTTKCVASGCNNYIASSGDTNCCESHSNKCPECMKYIDGDAMYCMDCLRDAIK